MRILLYSDLHISKTSSILPLYSDNPQYTYRQNMILQTADWLSQIMVNEKPDLIINLGDTFDQHTITSYDVHIASKFFQYFTDRMIMNNINIPHYVLVGNHEMINSNFNAIALLNNISNITVIDECTTIDNLSFLPYCNYKDIIDFPEGTYLFSHQDIQGSSVRGDFELPEGIDRNVLTKYKLVFNGHIHKPSIKNNIINVGSVTTHSFSDDESTVPQAYIFNTETLDLKIFKNLNCPLFRKFTINKNIEELYSFINTLDTSYKYILHIVCPFEIKEQVKKYLDDLDLVIANRLNVKINKKETETDKKDTSINLNSNINIKQTFKQFLDEVDLKYPKEIYNKILDELKI